MLRDKHYYSRLTGSSSTGLVTYSFFQNGGGISVDDNISSAGQMPLQRGFLLKGIGLQLSTADKSALEAADIDLVNQFSNGYLQLITNSQNIELEHSTAPYINSAIAEQTSGTPRADLFTKVPVNVPVNLEPGTSFSFDAVVNQSADVSALTLLLVMYGIEYSANEAIERFL